MWAFAGSIITALFAGGGCAALFRSRSQNRALDSDTLTKVAEAVQTVYERVTQDLRQEIDRVVEREKLCRKELDALHVHVVDLYRRQNATTKRLDATESEQS